MTFQMHIDAEDLTTPETFSVAEVLSYLPAGGSIGTFEEEDDGKRWAPVYGALGELVGTIVREP